MTLRKIVFREENKCQSVYENHVDKRVNEMKQNLIEFRKKGKKRIEKQYGVVLNKQ